MELNLGFDCESIGNENIDNNVFDNDDTGLSLDSLQFDVHQSDANVFNMNEPLGIEMPHEEPDGLPTLQKNYYILYSGVTVENIIYQKAKSVFPDKKGINHCKFADKARNILFDWLKDHEDNPYPTKKEMLELEFETGLDSRRIRVFLCNYRSRLLKRNPKNGIINQTVKVNIKKDTV